MLNWGQYCIIWIQYIPIYPYDHCLPHASHINLTHNSFVGLVYCVDNTNRVLVTLGSFQCKQCSNYYLFIIVPIAVAGGVLVMIIFIFNLTVTSGTINTFIFYVNILSINYSLFFPECNSRLLAAFIIKSWLGFQNVLLQWHGWLF